jgi:DNA replication protein DnaC
MAGYSLHELDICECEAGDRYRRDAEAYYARQSGKAVSNAFSRSGIPERYKHFTVQSWAEKAKHEAGKTHAAQAVQEWLAGDLLNGKNSILLYGSYGTGKTSLLTSALIAQIQTGRTGLWLEWFDFVDGVQGKYGAGDGSAQAAVELAQTVDILMLDDLGDSRKAEETPDRQRLLYQIINARMNHMRPILLTSNLTLSEMRKQFGTRTFDRIEYVCRLVEVKGDNWRKETSR